MAKEWGGGTHPGFWVPTAICKRDLGSCGQKMGWGVSVTDPRIPRRGAIREELPCGAVFVSLPIVQEKHSGLAVITAVITVIRVFVSGKLKNDAWRKTTMVTTVITIGCPLMLYRQRDVNCRIG